MSLSHSSEALLRKSVLIIFIAEKILSTDAVAQVVRFNSSTPRLHLNSRSQLLRSPQASPTARRSRLRQPQAARRRRLAPAVAVARRPSAARAPRPQTRSCVPWMDAGELDVFDAGLCDGGYRLGLAVGQRFRETITSRMRGDLVLREQLLPFASTAEAQPLLAALQVANRERYPRYWDELVGTADGSGVPLLHVILVNFRQEILPFIPNEDELKEEPDNDCSDILIVSELTAIAAHNEDANVALLGHTYLVRATSPDGSSFTAYTYAGELPSCAFGFNSNGVAFTLNSVPPVKGEIVAGAVARNFVSRDLLEARNLEDAMHRVCSPNVSVGHSYNLMDIRGRRIVNVETASGNRFAVHEAGAAPFFRANMYLHLQVKQVQDENSMSREKRAAQCSLDSKEKALSVLGDAADDKYPIYMTGPTLYTLCTVLVDLDEKTMTVYRGNPKNRDAVRVLRML